MTCSRIRSTTFVSNSCAMCASWMSKQYRTAETKPQFICLPQHGGGYFVKEQLGRDTAPLCYDFRPFTQISAIFANQPAGAKNTNLRQDNEIPSLLNSTI